MKIELGPATLIHGDCRTVLAAWSAAAFDAIVTDPPYGLEFMGKDWDRGVPGVEFWRAFLRVSKPGAHLVAFGGTRTWHRLACAIEDAGWEIRDTLCWMYGTGFPKSLDVSKAIDLAGGVSPTEQAKILRTRREAAGMDRGQLACVVGCTEASIRDWEEGRARAVGAAVEFITPSASYRTCLANVLGYTADERRAIGVSVARAGDGSVVGLGHSGVLRTGGNTPAAAAWTGWGTALKPAFEPIILARKPLDGTVAANVLAHGTGALNIDACRIVGPPSTGGASSGTSALGQGSGWNAHENRTTQIDRSMASGRWPANVVLDEEAALLVDEQTGVVGGGDLRSRGAATDSGFFVPGNETARDRSHGGPVYADSGGASRFFYCAKASRSERTHDNRVENKHPTVKPIALMRWLCRLVTPPGALVLDPFCGSGSTLVAALRENLRVVGIDNDDTRIAEERVRLEIDSRAHSSNGA